MEQMGHEAMLWSPSGERTKALRDGRPLVATGAIAGEFHPKVASGPQALAEWADVQEAAVRSGKVVPIKPLSVPYGERADSVETARAS